MVKIVVIGGNGRIGEKLVYNLRQDDQRVLVASRTSGVDAVSGFGLDQALEGAEVVIDVSNAPKLIGEEPLRYFEAAGKRLAAAGRAAGVQHHVVLSIVGTDRMQASAYFRGKKVQEDLIKASGLSYSIVRSTQFFEFVAGIVQDGTTQDVVMPPALTQPISGVDVAEALADVAVDPPLYRTIEIAGSERFRLPDLALEVLTAYEDPRRIVTDRRALYFGAELDEETLLPGSVARVGEQRFEDWLRDRLQPHAEVRGPWLQGMSA